MSVFYINESITLKNDEQITKVDEIIISKEDIITSSLNLKDIITYTFKLPKSTSKEQLEAEAEINFYENGGLDLSKQYKTHYIIKELEQEESYLIEAIAISEDDLHSKFDKIVQKTKYIDFISLSILSFSEFYETYNKEAKRDAFVYLDDKQSFLAVYEDGEYIYSKSLNNLNTLLKQISMDYDKFVETISTKGVDKENYEMDEFLIASEIDKFFSEYFMAINNRLSYGKNIFYLENIDNIYFYTPFAIKGLDSLKSFWDLSGINFEAIPIEDINFLDKLNLLYNTKNYKSDLNFSIFPRPPKFYKTRTFQLLVIVFLVFAIFGGDFGYRYYQNQKIEKRISELNKKVKIKSAILRRLKQINKKTLVELNKYEKEIAFIEKKQKYIKDVLEKSLYVLDNSKKTSKDLILFSKLLKKDKLKAFSISKDVNNTFSLGIYTKFNNREYISIFMNDLLLNGYKNVITDKITNIDNRYYTSMIRFSK